MGKEEKREREIVTWKECNELNGHEVERERPGKNRNKKGKKGDRT